MIKIIAGLGNPGSKYEGTRHNIGFMVLDRLSDELGLTFANSSKFRGELAVAEIGGEKVYFIKPDTYMNLSGFSVGALANFYKIKAQDVFVVHDEMNLPFGKLKLRHDGSAGGHNGLASIIEHLGSNFPRLKMGIGKKTGEDTVAHVLGRFTPEEKTALDEFVLTGTKAVLKVLAEGMTKAMTEYNAKK
ncbi:MAG: aminoacyl-tRNA hydrolase [Deferribacterales bacterium]|nr:aminoacyl-tRNA hydrolase [Deferribacterales bacterium]